MLPGKDMIGHWIDSARHMPPGQGNQDARQMLPGKDMIGHWIGSARHMPPGQGMIDTKDDTPSTTDSDERRRLESSGRVRV